MKKNILLLLSVLVATTSGAWNNIGHRIVTDVAYHLVANKTRDAVNQVLGYERAMVAMSSWADDIKNDTIYPEQSEWHFQDIDGGKSAADIAYLFENKKAEGFHLFAAKDSLVSVLRHNPGDADALKFIVHISGDEFQPMHMGHHDDLGGNRTRFTWFGQQINLHSLWDRYLIDYTGYTSTEYAQHLLCKYDSRSKEMHEMTELQCIMQTYDASTRIYDYVALLETQKDAEGRYPRGFEYKFAYNFIDTMELQLYLAGAQLAKLLDELYGD